MVGASCDIDEAFDDEADLCIDGEAEMKQDDKALIEGRSFCPSTDVIIVVENAGEYTIQCKVRYSLFRCSSMFLTTIYTSSSSFLAWNSKIA